MRLGTERIGPDEVQIDIHVDGWGQFNATFDEAEYTAPTRKELLERLAVAIKASRDMRPVEVSVLGLVLAAKGRGGWTGDGPYDPGIGVVDAKLRGKHAREYNAWLMVSEDGQKFKYSSSRRESIALARRLTVDERSEYLSLREAIRLAETALEDFVGKVQIDPEAAIAEVRKAAKPAKAVR